MQEVYITGLGTFLPNQPIKNEEMEEYLGQINGNKSRLKDRILRQNGIQQRYYALDKNQKSTHSNADLAALAVQNALSKHLISPSSIELLATGTTQGDLPVPGFASMVHGKLDLGRCEIASFQSVCASGMMALKNAYLQIKCGEKQNAISLGSEFASRLFKASRFEAQQIESLSFDAAFLRWMLSDGAGAAILENRANPNGLSLKVEWIDIQSHAHAYPLCMYTGKNDNKNEEEPTWLDYKDYESAANAGSLNLKQDVRLLDQVVEVGVNHYLELIAKEKIIPDTVDWLCCHYSSAFFKKAIQERMQNANALIPQEKWFSNLSTKGNTGAASIYIMLDELFYSGRLKPGDEILCMVPESGRFITCFMKLMVVSMG